MIRTQVYLPKDLHEDLSELALKLNVSMAELVREGVKKVVRTKRVKKYSAKEYLKILEETQGAWRRDSWPETEKRRRKIELEASKRRKASW